MEEWRDVPGFPGYQASSLGRVRSPRKILKLSIDTGGYLTVTLGHATQRRVHCLVMLAFVGPPPEGQEVCHDNGDKQNARLDNLYYGTRERNIEDAVRHGTAWWLKVPDTCPKGHSAVVRYGGRRVCRTCMNEYQNKWRAERVNGAQNSV